MQETRSTITTFAVIAAFAINCSPAERTVSLGHDQAADLGMPGVEGRVDADPEAIDMVETRSPAISLVANPSTIDFGAVVSGCHSAVLLELENAGADVATVSPINFTLGSSPHFDVVFTPESLVLNPGDHLQLLVRYRPEGLGTEQATLQIYFDQPGSPLEVPLSGESIDLLPRTETFTQTGGPQIDILLVIDDSCSMSEHQARLTTAFPLLQRHLDEQLIDYHLGVVTTDVEAAERSGNLVGTTKVITPSTPDAMQVFSDNVNVGIDGSGDEHDFDAMRLALSEPLLSGANAGFLRPDASLVVLFVSDEDDGSIDAISVYADFLSGLKAAPVLANAIVGGQSCSSLGDRYHELVNFFGGTSSDICSASWEPALTNLGSSTSLGYRSRFALREDAVPGSVEVEIDGVLVPALGPGGNVVWHYEASDHSILFEDAYRPEPNAMIAVTYRPSSLCGSIDLAISSVTTTPSVVQSGAVLTASFTLSNLGTTLAPASSIDLAISKNGNLSRTDPTLCSMPVDRLPAGESSSLTIECEIPNPLPQDLAPDRYYVAIIADPLDLLIESDESNNFAIATTTTTIAP